MVNLMPQSPPLCLDTGTIPLLAKLKDLFTQRGVQSYLVGGYIRDSLLGRATKDIDIALAGDAVELAKWAAEVLGGTYVLLDEVNRIARVVLAESSPSQKGAQWHLDFSAMRGSTIEEDLARRDFTIHALATNLGAWERGNSVLPLIDPFRGRPDLEKRLIRAVSETVFQDDPARLLRGVRLAAEYGSAIEGATENLMRSQSYLVATVAGERVREELCRLLSFSGASRVLRYLDNLGLLGSIIPELLPTKGVEQPKEHYWDIFEHSVETVAAVEGLLRMGSSGYEGEALEIVPWTDDLAHYFEEDIAAGAARKTLLKLAALLHDVAKPHCKAVEQSGRIRFLGHAKEGAAITGVILERLRFSGRETKMVQKMVEYHLRPGQMSNDGELPSRRAIYRYFRDTGEVGIDILFLGLADHLATRGPNLDFASWKEHVHLVEYVLAERERETSLTRPPKLIDGNDIMRLFGLSAGRRIGELLEIVREAQAAGEISSREEALSLVRQQLSQSEEK